MGGRGDLAAEALGEVAVAVHADRGAGGDGPPQEILQLQITGPGERHDRVVAGETAVPAVHRGAHRGASTREQHVDVGHLGSGGPFHDADARRERAGRAVARERLLHRVDQSPGDQVDQRTGGKYSEQVDRGVDEAKKRLTDAGIEFLGETFDSGVCNGAAFMDLDGNGLMLHRRYAPYPDGREP